MAESQALPLVINRGEGWGTHSETPQIKNLYNRVPNTELLLLPHQWFYTLPTQDSLPRSPKNIKPWFCSRNFDSVVGARGEEEITLLFSFLKLSR
jgi:hypothetical protein